jgi:hypothetical protein
MDTRQFRKVRPFDLVTESPNVSGDDRSVVLLPDLFASELSVHSAAAPTYNFIRRRIFGNLEQYPLSVISGLAERTVVSTRAKADPRSGRFDAWRAKRDLCTMPHALHP